MASHKTVLIAGANRGIGLHFVKTFMASGWSVIGTIRPETKSDESYKDLQSTGARILELDFKSETSIQQAAADFGDGPLDCLVNVGGEGVSPAVSLPVANERGEPGIKPTPQQWNEYTTEFLLEQLQGPFLLSKHFHSNLDRANGTIANISAGFGSISTKFSLLTMAKDPNARGLFIGYRMAKAALNQQTVTLARDYAHADENITIIALNPGHIATKMTGFKGVVDMDESVQKMVTIIEEAKLEDSGRFYDYIGDDIAF